MKSIIFVRDMNEEAVEKIKRALSETRVDFQVVLHNKCVTVEGSNDIVHIAKSAIREAGYTVE